MPTISVGSGLMRAPDDGLDVAADTAAAAFSNLSTAQVLVKKNEGLGEGEMVGVVEVGDPIPTEGACDPRVDPGCPVVRGR